MGSRSTEFDVILGVSLLFHFVCSGHNMSQADANSVAGESIRAGHTGTGCYKNHDHHYEKLKTKDGQLIPIPPDAHSQHSHHSHHSHHSSHHSHLDPEGVEQTTQEGDRKNIMSHDHQNEVSNSKISFIYTSLFLLNIDFTSVAIWQRI